MSRTVSPRRASLKADTIPSTLRAARSPARATKPRTGRRPGGAPTPSSGARPKAPPAAALPAPFDGPLFAALLALKGRFVGSDVADGTPQGRAAAVVYFALDALIRMILAWGTPEGEHVFGVLLNASWSASSSGQAEQRRTDAKATTAQPLPTKPVTVVVDRFALTHRAELLRDMWGPLTHDLAEALSYRDKLPLEGERREFEGFMLGAIESARIVCGVGDEIAELARGMAPAAAPSTAAKAPAASTDAHAAAKEALRGGAYQPIGELATVYFDALRDVAEVLNKAGLHDARAKVAAVLELSGGLDVVGVELRRRVLEQAKTMASSKSREQHAALAAIWAIEGPLLDVYDVRAENFPEDLRPFLARRRDAWHAVAEALVPDDAHFDADLAALTRAHGSTRSAPAPEAPGPAAPAPAPAEPPGAAPAPDAAAPLNDLVDELAIAAKKITDFWGTDVRQSIVALGKLAGEAGKETAEHLVEVLDGLEPKVERLGRAELALRTHAPRPAVAGSAERTRVQLDADLEKVRQSLMAFMAYRDSLEPGPRQEALEFLTVGLEAIDDAKQALCWMKDAAGLQVASLPNAGMRPIVASLDKARDALLVLLAHRSWVHETFQRDVVDYIAEALDFVGDAKGELETMDRAPSAASAEVAS